MKTGGAWIFLSHSNKDFEAVRRLRNELEALYHKPLMFFLKCVDDDSELDDLVKREIEVREWFLLCDSANARESRWVQRELEIITSDPDSAYATVDLEATVDVQLEQASRLARRATVFISYHRDDEFVAAEISEVLREHDFAVWDPQVELSPAREFTDTIASVIRDAAERGFVLLLLSLRALQSRWVEEETRYALAVSRDHRNVIPILLDSTVLSSVGPQIVQLEAVDFSQGSIRSNAETLVKELKRRPMQ